MRTRRTLSTTLALLVHPMVLAWALAAGAEQSAEPLTWGEIVRILGTVDTPEQGLGDAVGRLVNRPAKLAMAFVAEQTDKDGVRWHLFRHQEGNSVFLCHVTGDATGRKKDWSGTLTGEIRKIEFEPQPETAAS